MIQDIDVFELVLRTFEGQKYHSLLWTELPYLKAMSSDFILNLLDNFKTMVEIMTKRNVYHRDIFETMIQELNKEITKRSIGLLNYKRPFCEVHE